MSNLNDLDDYKNVYYWADSYTRSKHLISLIYKIDRGEKVNLKAVKRVIDFIKAEGDVGYWDWNMEEFPMQEYGLEE